LHFQTQLFEMSGDEGGGTGFLITQFGMLVNVAPPSNDFGLFLSSELGNAGIKGNILGLGQRTDQQQSTTSRK